MRFLWCDSPFLRTSRSGSVGTPTLRGGHADAQMANAIVSSARFEGAIIDGTDFSGVIIRKDIVEKMCATAKGVNSKTGMDTRESLFCP